MVTITIFWREVSIMKSSIGFHWICISGLVRSSQVPRPSCEPSELGNLTGQDNEADNQVGCMDRGMQAVPVLVEGGSQTQLTHPKNVYIQYESRSFTKEELTDTFSR